MFFPSSFRDWVPPPKLETPFWKCHSIGCAQNVYKRVTYCPGHQCAVFMCNCERDHSSIYCTKHYLKSQEDIEEDRIRLGC